MLITATRLSETAAFKGLYSVAEARHLTGVSDPRIRRCIWGYSVSEPVFKGDYAAAEGLKTVSFLDMVQIRLLSRLRQEGIGWARLRKAIQKGTSHLGTSHPLVTRRCRVLGKTIYVNVADHEGQDQLVDILTAQIAMEPILAPFLEELDFHDDKYLLAKRWWPMGKDYPVVVDPLRCFGRPILTKWGIPTRVIADSYSTTKSAREVAEWYEVDPDSVEAAVRFEEHLETRTAA